MRSGFSVACLVTLALLAAFPAHAQRKNAVWARTTAGAPITLDGVLDEAAWQQAETLSVRYGKNSGDPGSGYKEEGGKLAKDSTYALFRFLVDGNHLYLGITARDSSVGGSRLFNRHDGFLMCVKNHTSLNRPAPPEEFLYSWWWHHAADSATALNVGNPPCFKGIFGQDSCVNPVRPPASVTAWDAVTRVHGLSNSDAAVDTGYTTEMRFDLGSVGYDVTDSDGDIVEWSVSAYDNDWYWPQNLARWANNRAWLQNPWGHDAWYDEVRIFSRPSVTVNTNPLPALPNDILIPKAGVFPPPTINGSLSETVWSRAPGIRIRYGDENVRNAHPGIGKWRYGWFQPTLPWGQKAVVDTADATVKMFVKDDTLYVGFDVNDQVVQYHSSFDRWDGFILTINDRVLRRVEDRNLESWRMSFQVGPTGALLAQDKLPYLRDTLLAVRCLMTLKPGTTVDTLGQQADVGYQAEMAIDLTKLGYPSGLGDRTLFIGVDHLDGDNFTPFTDSYGTRTWWYRQYEHECCPANAYMDPDFYVTTDVGEGGPPALALLGVSPNPFTRLARIRYTLPRESQVTLEVFDVLGRRVRRQLLGVQSPGPNEASLSREGLSTGVYLYRVRTADPVTGAPLGMLSGKVMYLR